MKEPSNYLSRKIDQHEKKAAQKDIPFLEAYADKQRAMFEFPSEAGVMHKIEIGDTTISMQLDNLSEIDLPDNLDVFSEDILKKIWAGINIEPIEIVKLFLADYTKSLGSLEDIRILKNFSIKNATSEFSIDSLGGGLTVYVVNKDAGTKKLITKTATKADIIFCLNYAINTPLGLIALFHELGHLKHRQAKPDEFDKILKSLEMANRDGEIEANILEMERDAWAFAIATLKPFLKDLGISTEEIIGYKDSATRSYIY